MKKIRCRGTRVGPATLVILTILSGATHAGYWTVPIDYYNDWNHIRLPLSSSTNGMALNLGTGAGATDLNGVRNNVGFIDDDQRGYVSQFVSSELSYIQHSYNLVEWPNAAVETDGSLSIWYKPSSTTVSQFLASRGNSTSGFSLYTTVDGAVFTFWDYATKGSVIATFPENVDTTDWINLIIAQAAGSDGPYVAIYANGVLIGKSSSPDISKIAGGVLGLQNTLQYGYIGSAAVSGYIYTCNTIQPDDHYPNASNIDDDCYYYYVRQIDSNTPILGIAPFFTGTMVEFRWFPGINFVCSDKTQSDYQLSNQSISIGQRCSIASDVTSIATDRIEQANVVARLPLKANDLDHNFAGLGSPISPDPKNSLPNFIQDDLRNMVSKWVANNTNMILYEPNSVEPVSGRFGVSYWMYLTESMTPAIDGGAPVAQYKDDDGRTTTISSAFANNTVLIYSVYTDGDNRIAQVRSDPLPLYEWVHIAFSLDTSTDIESNPVRTRSLQLFVNGELVATDEHAPVLTDKAYFFSVGSLTLAPTNGKFRGLLSDVVVLNAPITMPQARQLSTRFANALVPVYDRFGIVSLKSKPSTKNGYVYQSATVTNSWVKPGASDYTYDSIDVSFSYDWNEPGAKWRGIDSNGSGSQDCEYALGGVYTDDVASANVSTTWGVADSNSIVLCFSPAKIKKGIAPFTLALRYSEYDDKVLYLPVLDTLLPDDVRYALIQYSETEGVTGIRTDFVINIGRYNIILQAKSDAPALYGGNQPNYVSALYFGADPLISSLLQDPTVMCMFMFQNNAVGTGSWQYNYVDQLQLLNEFDVKLAKDR